jgi:hypothetical protein
LTVGTGPVRLGYARPHFFTVDGQSAIDSSVRAGHTLLAAELAVESEEQISGRTAEAYFAERYPEGAR